MIQEQTEMVVADNTGAKRAMCFRVLGQRKRYAHLGDVVRVAIKEATPSSAIKKGQVCTAVIVRTGHPIHRADGSYVRFDQNACVIVDVKLNPIGTRIFGPVARELRLRRRRAHGRHARRTAGRDERKPQTVADGAGTLLQPPRPDTCMLEGPGARP